MADFIRMQPEDVDRFFQDRPIVGRWLVLSLDDGRGGRTTADVFANGVHEIGGHPSRVTKVFLRDRSCIVFPGDPLRVMFGDEQVVGVAFA